MHKKFLSILVVPLLSLLLAVPALAADHGVIYDETNKLETDKLIELGTETLPAFTEEFGIDLRVDVLTNISDFDSLADAAAYVYEKYEYGCGDEKTGVSLSIALSADETGYTMEDWTCYAAGDDKLADYVVNDQFVSAVDYHLNTGAWEGDLAEDARSLSMAVETFVDKMHDYCAPDSGEWVLPRSGQSYVFDTAGLLTGEEQEKLEGTAKELMEKYDFGVYIVTLDDFRDYTDRDVFHAAMNIYHEKENGFGTGAEKDGLMLLLSVDDRDYCLFTNGKRGNYAFNDDGREAMTKYFLDDFGDDKWYSGFEDYLTWADNYLEKAEEGNPYSAENEPMDIYDRISWFLAALTLLLLPPLIPAFLCRRILVKMMGSVKKGTEASAYVSQKLRLTKSDDIYIRTTESKRYNPPSSSSDGGGGGGSSSSHSGSSSGTSGKF